MDSKNEYLVTIVDLGRTPEDELIIYELGHYAASVDGGLTAHNLPGFAASASTYLQGKARKDVKFLWSYGELINSGCAEPTSHVIRGTSGDAFKELSKKPSNTVLTGTYAEVQQFITQYPELATTLDIEGHSGSCMLAAQVKALFYQIAQQSEHIPKTKLTRLSRLGEVDFSEFDHNIIIKPTDESMGQGTFVTSKSKLKNIILALQEQDEAVFERALQQLEITSVEDIAAVRYWRELKNSNPFILIQNIVATKLVLKSGQYSKATIRLLVGCKFDGKNVSVDILSGYYKLPPMGASGKLSTDTVVSHIPDQNPGLYSQPLRRPTIDKIKTGLNKFFPTILKKIFENKPEYYLAAAIDEYLATQNVDAYEMILFHLQRLSMHYAKPLAATTLNAVERLFKASQNNAEILEGLFGFCYSVLSINHVADDTNAYIRNFKAHKLCLRMFIDIASRSEQVEKVFTYAYKISTNFLYINSSLSKVLYTSKERAQFLKYAEGLYTIVKQSYSNLSAASKSRALKDREHAASLYEKIVVKEKNIAKVLQDMLATGHIVAVNQFCQMQDLGSNITAITNYAKSIIGSDVRVDSETVQGLFILYLLAVKNVLTDKKAEHYEAANLLTNAMLPYLQQVITHESVMDCSSHLLILLENSYKEFDAYKIHDQHQAFYFDLCADWYKSLPQGMDNLGIKRFIDFYETRIQPAGSGLKL